MQFSFTGSNLLMTFSKINAAGADVWVAYEQFVLM
jgi:hypothetical protein